MENFFSSEQKGRILIVDDEPYLLEGLFDVLQQEGFKVTTCKTTQEAKTITRRIKFRVALIDLKMPDADGIELIKYLKQFSPGLSILILTAYPGQETAIQGIKLGVTDYLIKPVNVRELIEALNKSLDSSMDIEDIKLQLGGVKEELNKAKQALVRKNKFSSLGEVSMEVFHEIKNMLAVMNVSIYYLNKNIKTQDGKISKHLDIINNQVQHSNQVIMSLLNLSRGEDKQKKDVDLNQIINDILELVHKELSLKSIKVVTNLSSDLFKIEANPQKIKQVFLNFILNSKDAMPDGGELRISSYNEAERTVIEFSDSGVGISSDNLEKIFTPFYTTKKEKEGTGLGLTVSKQIVEEFDGDLKVKSVENKGSQFIVKFPKVK